MQLRLQSPRLAVPYPRQELLIDSCFTHRHAILASKVLRPTAETYWKMSSSSRVTPCVTDISLGWSVVTAAAKEWSYDPQDAVGASLCDFGDNPNRHGSRARKNGKTTPNFCSMAESQRCLKKSITDDSDDGIVPFGRYRFSETYHFENMGFG